MSKMTQLIFDDSGVDAPRQMIPVGLSLAQGMRKPVALVWGNGNSLILCPDDSQEDAEFALRVEKSPYSMRRRGRWRRWVDLRVVTQADQTIDAPVYACTWGVALHPTVDTEAVRRVIISTYPSWSYRDGSIEPSWYGKFPDLNPNEIASVLNQAFLREGVPLPEGCICGSVVSSLPDNEPRSCCRV